MEGYHIYMFYNILHTFRFDLILFPRDAKTPVGSFLSGFQKGISLTQHLWSQCNNGHAIL